MIRVSIAIVLVAAAVIMFFFLGKQPAMREKTWPIFIRMNDFKVLFVILILLLAATRILRSPKRQKISPDHKHNMPIDGFKPKPDSIPENGDTPGVKFIPVKLG